MEKRKECKYWLCENDIADTRMSLTFEKYVFVLNSLIRKKTNYTLYTESTEEVNYDLNQREDEQKFFIIVSKPTFLKYAEI